MWLLAGVAQVDLEARDLMETAVTLARGMFGLASYAELRDMPIDDYLLLIEEVNRQSKRTPGENDGTG